MQVENSNNTASFHDILLFCCNRGFSRPLGPFFFFLWLMFSLILKLLSNITFSSFSPSTVLSLQLPTLTNYYIYSRYFLLHFLKFIAEEKWVSRFFDSQNGSGTGKWRCSTACSVRRRGKVSVCSYSLLLSNFPFSFFH